jgi:PhnB protein
MKIPNGHQALMPYLILDHADAFLHFVKTVFAAEIAHETRNDNGKLGHCEARIQGGTIMFSNSTEQFRQRNADMFVYVEDADKTFSDALATGGTVIMPLDDKDYGRSGGVEDPAGNIWWITAIK